jgi:hypothetical protein
MKPAAAASAFGVVAAIAIYGAPAHADDYYVAPDGDDDAPGSLEQPFGTVERAQEAAAPGDTVFLRGGVYAFSGTQASVGVSFTKSGASGQPIRYFAYPGETPIFDLFELRPQARVTGLDVRCNWIHIRGLEVRGVRQLIVGDSWSVRIRGDHNMIEQLNVHDGEAPGIFITSGASNVILNCDSHHNYDPLEDGGNADGFGCHSTGGDNVLRGCRAYENSDDGFDFINAPGTCTVEDSWAFRNGFIPDTTMTGANGAGFKAGGFGDPPNVPATGVPRHVVRRSLAFGNRSIGFYANYHPGGIDFFHNTAFDNPANFDMRTAPGSTSMHTLRNNIAAAPGREITNFSGGSDDFNSWTLPVEVSSADFMSMDQGLALAPRQADGSLPNMSLLRLEEGSDLIDKGEDVGLDFAGSAPDLGAYEWDAPGVGPMDAGVPDASVGTDAAVTAAGTGGAGGATMQPPAAGSQPPPAGGTGAPIAQPTAAGTEPSRMTTAGAPAIGPSGNHTQASGCDCRVGQSRSAASPWLALLTALWITARRARRNRPRTCACRRRAWTCPPSPSCAGRPSPWR